MEPIAQALPTFSTSGELSQFRSLCSALAGTIGLGSIGGVAVAAVVSATAVIDQIDGTFALMAIPTMTSTLLLSPSVMRTARAYFEKLTP